MHRPTSSTVLLPILGILCIALAVLLAQTQERTDTDESRAEASEPTISPIVGSGLHGGAGSIQHGGDNVLDLPPAGLPALASIEGAPAPQVGHLSMIRVRLVPWYDFPDGQLVVEFPALWKILGSTPPSDQVLQAAGSVMYPGEVTPAMSTYLIWNRALSVMEAFEVQIRASPTGGENDQRHHELHVFLHDRTYDLTNGQVAMLCARVSGPNRPGSFSSDCLDVAMDLQNSP